MAAAQAPLSFSDAVRFRLEGETDREPCPRLVYCTLLTYVISLTSAPGCPAAGRQLSDRHSSVVVAVVVVATVVSRFSPLASSRKELTCPYELRRQRPIPGVDISCHAFSRQYGVRKAKFTKRPRP